MTPRYWHRKDHIMPDTGGVDPVTGATYYGEVLSGKKSVGQALFEAAQTGYYRNQQSGMVMPEDRPEPEPMGYIEPTVKAHVGTPSGMAGDGRAGPGKAASGPVSGLAVRRRRIASRDGLSGHLLRDSGPF